MESTKPSSSREAYVKYTWRIIGLEVIVALQWLGGEDPHALRNELRIRIALVMTQLMGNDTFNAIRDGVERAVTAGWPERSWFLEVVDDDDLEVQVYDPRGFVKVRCDCPCKRPKVTYCDECGGTTEGGHERDSSGWCHCGIGR